MLSYQLFRQKDYIIVFLFCQILIFYKNQKIFTFLSFDTRKFSTKNEKELVDFLHLLILTFSIFSIIFHKILQYIFHNNRFHTTHLL